MSEVPFSRQIRRRALRADVAGYLGMTVISAALIPWGLYFLLGLCADCDGLNVGGVIVGLGMLALAGSLVWSVTREIRARRAPDGDPLSAQLKSWGDPPALAAQLDADFAGRRLRRQRYYLSARWLVMVPGRLHVLRVEDLVWAYVESVRHTVSGIIPVATTYRLWAWERSGRGVSLALKKHEAEEALTAIAAAAPWMLLGYDEQTKESWNNDREELLALVARRKAGA